MSTKTIKEIMEEGQLKEGDEANDLGEESDDEEPDVEDLEEELDEEDFSSDDDRCTACGSYNITIRASGYVQCHDCNFLDRKEEDESFLDED